MQTVDSHLDSRKLRPQAAFSPLRSSVLPAVPSVSVVIPTRNRPVLVERAVRCALGQTLRQLEVIVVIDGLDQQTQDALERIPDGRLHVLSLRENVGGAEARNTGIRYARGKWVALLDDDDEWMPTKLEQQYRAAQAMPGPYILIASKFIERTETTERVLPGRLPGDGEAFSEYMFVRRGWSSGEGFLQTSTWFASRDLMVRVPFTKGLKRCQDLDWLLRATALRETAVVVLSDVLATFHHDERVERVSRSADWAFLHQWAASNRSYFTPRAYSFFIAAFCIPSAAAQHAGLRVSVSLLRDCIFEGSANVRCLLTFLICWWIPEASRRSIRNRLSIFRVLERRRLRSLIHTFSMTKAKVTG